ncbi:3-hydroxyacyl-CoA dehydrogenase NAD-binding domain-containing protein [Williamsia sp. 1135]|uniref:3-hydroxyacyl-CoA dehydrogenase NAD-binding domain-containing protein n=1 Tax=Williamsia sp. 1135 TaxID=1889262 RepID=UPI000A1222B7|nr:3-hydroxyacyl-CoA dehydrogenase NAD-binding domain-containing protein [Williamsia sp. 1135]ORM27824.1 3-hydroxyacyl-CoA dehydrogenase [Williamsia sp. 1135]
MNPVLTTETDAIIGWHRDGEGIVTLTMDDPGQATNTMTDAMADALLSTVERLEAEKDSIAGVIITSGKETFFAGGDLNRLMNAGPADVADISAGLDHFKMCFRRIETLGRPVVAAINGTALGGGFEVALAAHHRIALNKKGSVLGLPEVTLGVLPGAGGVTRVVRLLGITDAVLGVVGEGRRMVPAKALDVGIIDEVVSTQEELIDRARAWIADNPKASQPLDRKGYRIPGGTPATPALAAQLPAYPANLRKQLKGSPMPAPIAVLAVAVEGAQVDLDTAFAIETRYCAQLICGQISTNMIKALFFDLNAVNNGASRPQDRPVRKAEKVAVLGAGMMGAAIAYVSAQSGIEVVLRDVTIEAAERGKDYSRRLLDGAVAKGRISADARESVLARIIATDNISDVAGADLVVEAVFEDIELKRRVLAEVADHVGPGALLASNTSALPIAEMAAAVDRPADVIGLHFFSPVDKMPLVEIVVGENTSDDALARGLDFVRQIRKTPIVVKDAYGCYANRVIAKFVDEALSLVAEGMHPASAEQAALQAGFPAGALTLFDEINMKTIAKIRAGFIADANARDVDFVTSASYPLVDRMLGEFDRPGRLEGRGFYEYDGPGGARGRLWPQLAEQYHRPDVLIPFEDAKERMLVAAALEAVRCLDEGVVSTVAEANIGSIMGIGYPVWTGGTLQYINQYAGGPAGFVVRADELRGRYGDRFVVPESLRGRAGRDERYL